MPRSARCTRHRHARESPANEGNRMKRAIIIAATILFAVAPVTRAADAKPATPRPLAWLGMGYTWMDNKDGRKFLVVQKLSPDGPALKAGLRPGDILTTVNGQRVDFGDDLEFLLFLTER